MRLSQTVVKISLVAVTILLTGALLASMAAPGWIGARVPAAQARAVGPWADTSLADFSGCTTLTNTVVTNVAGGEVRLAATMEDYFDGAALSASRWISQTLFTWGGASVSVATRAAPVPPWRTASSRPTTPTNSSPPPATAPTPTISRKSRA